MFMFCYFYDDDNDDLPNVLTLKKKKKSVYQGLEGLECWQVVRNAIFLGVFSVWRQLCGSSVKLLQWEQAKENTCKYSPQLPWLMLQ